MSKAQVLQIEGKWASSLSISYMSRHPTCSSMSQFDFDSAFYRMLTSSIDLIDCVLNLVKTWVESLRRKIASLKFCGTLK